MVSRSFGTRLRGRDELRAAVTAFATRAGEKLRTQRMRAGALAVFLHTSPFDEHGPHYANSFTTTWDRPTRDTGRLVRAAVRGLDCIYREGPAYQRAGVLLPDLSSGSLEQGVLFAEPPDAVRRADRLMDCVDRINRRHGRGAVHYAGEDLGSAWHMRQRHKSSAFTTDWDALPVAKAHEDGEIRSQDSGGGMGS